MGLLQRPDSIPENALASIGQVNLMYIYSKLFGEYGQVASQVLLTKTSWTEEKGAERDKYLSDPVSVQQHTIVNENDTISRANPFGDNDTLSAIVSVLVKRIC